MALKAIIYKAKVSFSDLDTNRYADHEPITIARHPSETEERMMIRLLAWVMNAPENNDRGTLEFGKDMWEADEPALCQSDLTGALEHWIDLGQPEEKRLVRCCGRSRRVTVYSFSNTTSTWWAGVADKMSRVKNLTVWQLAPEQSQALGSLANRAMDLQITLQDGILWISEGERSVEITPVRLCL
ncbi:MAG: YaeQ family protein [Verrucomicrobiaceae bacterium]|nr:YaeQ family protein [Verrucomicrobiaceae bacterium]